ncbi:MAG TPA: glycosyltransferase [Polyangiaceae bacterium]
MRAPRLSIVTPTYNRRQRLGLVLSALEAQAVPKDSFEVIVVDDGSTDGTTEWLEQQRYGFPLRALRQRNAGPAQARNTGVLTAVGELVLFLDDDVVPVPELITEHLRSHAAESVEVVVLGPLASLPSYAQPWVAWQQAKIEQQYEAMQRGDYEPTFRQFWTGNASVARRHLIDVGLFNAKYLRGEDVELGYRLSAHGLKFRFNAKAVGLHHAERSLRSWEDAHTYYGQLEVELFAKLGHDMLIRVLAENFARLHPYARTLLRRVVGQPLLDKSASAVLHAYLASPAAPRMPIISLRTCSLLANVLYWRASAAELGPARYAEVLERADRLLEAAR